MLFPRPLPFLMLVAMAHGQESASLQCNGADAIAESPVKLEGNIVGPFTFDTPVYTEAPLCEGKFQTSDATGFWFGLPNTNDVNTFRTFTACANSTSQEFRVEVLVYSDMVIQTEGFSSAPVGTCAELKCVPTSTIEHFNDIPTDERASSTEARDAVCAKDNLQAVTWEAAPFYNYFVFARFIGSLTTPAEIEFYQEYFDSSLAEFVPPNDFKGHASFDGFVHANTEVSGTLTRASVDAVPLCSTPDQEPGTKYGVWYRNGFNWNTVADGKMTISVCGYGEAKLAIYIEDPSVQASYNLQCLTTGEEACEQELMMEDPDQEYFIFVYTDSNEDALATGDFTMKYSAEAADGSGGSSGASLVKLGFLSVVAAVAPLVLVV